MKLDLLNSYLILQLRGTHVDFYRPVHAQEQGVKVDVVNWGLVRPLWVVMFDFQTNPCPCHVSQTWQKGGDEV